MPRLDEVGRPGSALVEAWPYRAGAAAGVRVPGVLAEDPDRGTVIVEWPRGRSLWKEHPQGISPAVWRRAGEDLRRLHEIAVGGFVPLGPTELGVEGSSERWCPFARHSRHEGLHTLADSRAIDPGAARDRLHVADERRRGPDLRRILGSGGRRRRARPAAAPCTANLRGSSRSTWTRSAARPRRPRGRDRRHACSATIQCRCGQPMQTRPVLRPNLSRAWRAVPLSFETTQSTELACRDDRNAPVRQCRPDQRRGLARRVPAAASRWRRSRPSR